MTRSKPLILDVDGVVIRGQGDDGAPWFQTLGEDLGIDRDTLTQHFFSRQFLEALRGRADIRLLLAELFPVLNIKVTVDEFIDYWFSHDAGVNHALLDHVSSLRHRHGLRVCLATNQEKHRADYIWKSLGLRDHFDGIVASHDIGACKPEPAFFSIADQELSIIEPAGVLFFDDRQSHVLAARQHGWQADVFSDNERFRKRIDHWLAEF